MSGDTKIRVGKITAKINFESIQESIANACANEISARSPKSKGNYKDGWTTTIIGEGSSRKVIVHNVNAPTLTHLLENGHLTRKLKGGTGKVRVAPKPHIRPAANKFSKKYVEAMKKVKIDVKSDLTRR